MLAWTIAFAVSAALAETPKYPSAAPASHEPVTKLFPVSGLKSVEVRVSAGVVAVARADTDKVQVQVVPKRFGRACAVTIDLKGDRVLVYAREKRKSYYGLSWGQDSCEAEVTVRMPQHLELDAATGSGAIAASGIQAKIKFRAGSGSLRLQDCSGPLEAQTGSGTIVAEGLKAPAHVRSGSGGVRLVFAEAPASGDIRVETGSGAIEVALPAGTKAATAARSGSGSIRNNLADDPKAPLHVVAKSGSGDITFH